MTTTTTDLPWHFSRNYSTVNNGVPVWVFLLLVGVILVLCALLIRAASAK